MSLGQIRRRVFGALMNFISDLSEGDACVVKKYVPYTPLDSVTLEYSTTILVLLGVIIALLAIIGVLVVSLIRSAKKQNQTSELILKQMQGFAQNMEDLARFPVWARSPPSDELVSTLCECCQTQSTDTTITKSQDHHPKDLDVSADTFVLLAESERTSSQDESNIPAAKEDQDSDSISIVDVMADAVNELTDSEE